MTIVSSQSRIADKGRRAWRLSWKVVVEVKGNANCLLRPRWLDADGFEVADTSRHLKLAGGRHEITETTMLKSEVAEQIARFDPVVDDCIG